MTSTTNQASLADKGQAIALRLLAKAGGHDLLKNPAIRSKVERALYQGSKSGFKAQTVAGRAFTKKAGSGDAARTAPTKPRREFDLTPTEDQETIAAVAAELADELLRPAAAKADAERALPDEIRAQATEMGLTLVGVPAELGGIAEERSAVMTALVLEQLARGDMGLAVAIMAPAAVATAIAGYGTSAQQETYLPAFTDEKKPAVAALALAEAGPLADPRTPATTATRDGADLVITGEKALVPCADAAELFVISVMLDGAARLVIVEAGTEGLTTSEEPAMGVRAAHTGRLHLNGVRVPAENLLGKADDTLDAIRRSRLAWAALACGTGRAVLDQVRQYVVERKAFGEPIGHRQAVAFTVSNIAIELDGLRLVTLRAAARLDAGDDAGAAETIAHARALVGMHATQIGSDAVQLLGGHGFVKEFDNERWYRDLRGAGVLEGGVSV
ncbi:acyl-CoA dehydrogenase family protein [Dermacoccus nishinomiyaensis]